MTLLYSINGKPTPYPIEPVSPASPVDAFSTLLSEELGREALDPERKAIPGPARTSSLRAYRDRPHDPHRKQALTAQDIMSDKVCCIQAHSTIAEAEEIMQTRKFRHLPVISANGTLIGILSDRDLFHAIKDPSQAVSTRMSERVLTATRDTPLKIIAESLLQNRISAMPIVDTDHLVVGILTTTDILRAIVTSAPVDLWV